MLNHILEHQYQTPKKQMQFKWQTLQKKETSFFDSQLTPRVKMKIPKPYCTSIGQTQRYPRISFVYSLKCRQISSDNNFTKNVIFRSNWTPGAKIKNLKPYCASTRHDQSDPRISFGYDLRCRRSSSDKLFFRTDGRTDGQTGITTIYSSFLQKVRV